MANLSNINNKFIVEDSGDVGIGVTTATTKLHIGGTAPGDSIIRQDSTVSGTNWEIGERAAGKWQIFEDDGDTIVATFMSTGNVGIGTASPSEILHLNKTSGTGCFIRFQNTGGSGVYIGGRSEVMEMYTNGSEKMRIDSSGNVGIGTNSPGGLLTIKGTGDAIRVESTNTGAGGAQIDLLHFTTSPADNDTFALINMGGYYTGTTSVYGTSIKSIWTDVSARNAALTFSTNNAGTLAERMRIKSTGSIYSVNSIQGTYFGQDAGNPANVTGVGNTSIGYATGQLLTSGTLNTCVGRSAGEKLTTGAQNVFIGNHAGYNNVDGIGNVNIGINSGYTSPGQNYNTFVGRESGYFNQANGNVAVGRNSLMNNTTAEYNTAIGYQCFANSTTSAYLTGLGYRAGYFFTAGNENTMIGYNAGLSTAAASTGGENTFVGSNSGASTSGISGSGNTTLGRYTLFNITSGSFNTAIGHQANYNNTTGIHNTAIGKDCLVNAYGSYNIGVGSYVGDAITSGNLNTAGGYGSMSNTQTGVRNTGWGAYTLTDATESYNTAVGYAAANSLATGEYNVAVGYEAMTSGLGSTRNVAVGCEALKIVIGNFNTAIGDKAGDILTSGSNNTCIGYNSDTPSNSSTNTVVLGNTAIQSLRCQVQTISSLSDKRDKTNIKDSEYGLDLINSLRPVTFDWNQRDGERKGLKDLGFIAQDLQKVDDEHLSFVSDEDPEKLSASYGRLIPVLVKAIKELKAEIELLKNK